MELRDRAVSPWPLPPARTPLEVEANLLDADVQDLLGTEESSGDEPPGGSQLQRATHTELPTIVKLHKLNCCVIPVTAAGGGSVFEVLAEAVAGLDFGAQGGEVDVLFANASEGVAHSSDSSPVVFIVIASDFEGQQDTIFEVLEGSVRFSPDGRLPHTLAGPAAAWDERYSGIEEGCVLSNPGSAEQEHACMSLADAKAPGAKKAAKHPPPSGIAAPLSERQGQAEFQPTVLSHVEDFAGRLAALEVSEVAPIPTPRGSDPEMLGIPAASRKTCGPALHEARTQIG